MSSTLIVAEIDLFTISTQLHLFVNFSRTGVFSLTPEYGLQFILNCRKPGFHPHPKEPSIYEV